MTRPTEPTLRAVVLMYDTVEGSLTMQYPPEVPLELVLHLLTMAGQSVDTSIRRQNGGLIIPHRGNGSGT